MSDKTPIELAYGCTMCGSYIPDEHSGLCAPCGWEHSENEWTDENGTVYSKAEAEALFESGEAIEVEL